MVSRRLAVLCIVVFNVTLHVRNWMLGITPASAGMLGPYYDEFWTAIWVMVALLLASSIRRDARAGYRGGV